jgi:hypothetical protein
MDRRVAKSIVTSPRNALSEPTKPGRRPPRPPSFILPPLVPRPRLQTGSFAPWRCVAARGGEAERWQCVDGRWISIALGDGAALGTVVVLDSSGRRESVDSYEDALRLIDRWRSEVG